MDFFDKTGKMAIGSRLRMLTDRVTSDAAQIYELYGIDIKPKWFPLFFVLADGEEKTVTGIAKEIGHSHPSVSNIAREMAAKGMLRGVSREGDRRRNVIALSPHGMEVAAKIMEVCKDVGTAVEDVSRETRNDLWRAIGEWEERLAQKSLLQRVREARKAREGKDIRIVDYEPRYEAVFKSLNEQWITRYWKLEPHDVECLDHPQESILDKGGHIFVATYKGQPVGVCALSKMDSPVYDYELVKLAVSPDAQGRGIGTLLCQAVIDKAKELGAKMLFLESNTLLRPAIHTYRKLGFEELPECHSDYERGNIQMELNLTHP